MSHSDKVKEEWVEINEYMNYFLCIWMVGVE